MEGGESGAQSPRRNSRRSSRSGRLTGKLTDPLLPNVREMSASSASCGVWAGVAEMQAWR